MADNALPDELVSEILSPALRVSDEEFTRISTATFAKYCESTSAYLVVCKSWLRVATPLLYHVVILRSKAQAVALATTLTKNKELGRFIKKLRVEGGFGPSMNTILESAPNITEIYLSFAIWSPDTTDGLCKGLKLVNPTRLILHDVEESSPAPKNQAVTDLADTVAGLVPTWTRLTTLHCPNYLGQPALRVIGAIAETKLLESVFVPSNHRAIWAFQQFPRCPLKTIHVTWPYGAELKEFVFKDADPKLKAILQFSRLEKKPAEEHDIIQPSLNPFYVPMHGARPELQDAVWSRVLYFAMRCPERADSFPAAVPNRKSSLPFLLVSKTFLRLGTPLLYDSVVVDSRHNFRAVVTFAFHPPKAYPIRAFRGLIRGGAAGFLDGVIHSACATLVHLDIELSSSQTISSAQLIRLRSLQTLRLTGHVQLSSSPAQRIRLRDEHDAFAQLRELKLDRCTVTCVTVFKYFSLPAIRVLKINLARGESHIPSTIQKLLEAHGTKLTDLSLQEAILAHVHPLDHCPNLQHLSIIPGDDFLAPAAIIVRPKKSVPSLVKVTIDTLDWPSGLKKAKISWAEFLDNLDLREKLPNVRELVFSCFTWPTTERDIARSHWVEWAEKLMEVKIDLVDKEGKKWRPRLKVGAASR
ncbi:F-box domain-containing protein [Mycena chlorophos]|uniref:F-box domain-containing protein n=1 Tax=Mycena chlorophos TaxID=658473 RepID=A0A8H6VW88_MYCCL|nr:F-box domain-containing protein [Mycena chlorophos]